MSEPLYRTMDSALHERGPFTGEEISQAIADGWADAQTPVQVEGDNEWTRLGKIPEFADTLRRRAKPLSAIDITMEEPVRMEGAPVGEQETMEAQEAAAEQAEAAEFNRRLNTATPERTAWVTLALIGLNVLVAVCIFVATPSTQVLLHWGANWGPLTATGQWGRLLSCCFLHGDAGHLLGNMFGLLLWGALTERLFGKGFYLAIYLGCGLAGSLTSLGCHPLAVSCGASGAVFGLCGALLSYLAREQGQVPERVLTRLLLGSFGYVCFNLWHGLGSPGIDLAAHIGGLASGVAFGFAAARPLDLESRKALTRRSIVLLAVCVGVVLAGLFSVASKSNAAYGSLFHALRTAYVRGEGVPKGFEEVVKLYREATWLGDATAQRNLGLKYAQGQGVEKDYTEAVKWYRKAAEQGNARAQHNLGVCYQKGWGVSQDYAEAVKWLRKAAEQGNADAENGLGYCYGVGQGVEKDYVEAAKWLCKAAEQGNADAETILGFCYAIGQGVEKDDAEAVKWYRKAAEQGDARAQAELKRLQP